MIKKMANVLMTVFLMMACNCPALAEEPVYTKEELARMSAAAAGVKAEDLEKVMVINQEATAYFGYLLCENMLPSTSQKDLNRLEAKINPPAYVVKYPVQVVIDIEMKLAQINQQYTLKKSGIDKPWKVIAGYRIGADKKKTVLKLPSEENQKKANDKLPELMKDINSQMTLTTPSRGSL